MRFKTAIAFLAGLSVSSAALAQPAGNYLPAQTPAPAATPQAEPSMPAPTNTPPAAGPTLSGPTSAPKGNGPNFFAPGAPSITTYLEPPPLGRPSDAVDAIRSNAAARAENAGRFWMNGEYLLWYTESMATAPLAVLVSPKNAFQGALVPTAGFTPLWPNHSHLSFGESNGFRVEGGYRFSPDFAIDAGFFMLEKNVKEDSYGGSGLTGSSGLAEPYIQAATGTTIFLYAALPGQYPGSISTYADTQLWGLETNLRWDTYHTFADRNELLFGFRYLNLAETEQVTSVGYFPTGTTLSVQDVFRTHNEFYGPQIGLHSRLYGGERFSADMITKIGIGDMHQQVQSFGSNTYFYPDGTVSSQAHGLYAQGANLGKFERDQFAMESEVTLRLGYNVTSNIRLSFGYSILYMSSVLRAGSQINPVINDGFSRFISNTAQSNSYDPSFNWRASSYWAQGLNLGITFGY